MRIKEKCLETDLQCVNGWSSSTVQWKRVPKFATFVVYQIIQLHEFFCHYTSSKFSFYASATIHRLRGIVFFFRARLSIAYLFTDYNIQVWPNLCEFCNCRRAELSASQSLHQPKFNENALMCTDFSIQF